MRSVVVVGEVVWYSLALHTLKPSVCRLTEKNITLMNRSEKDKQRKRERERERDRERDREREKLKKKRETNTES